MRHHQPTPKHARFWLVQNGLSRGSERRARTLALWCIGLVWLTQSAGWLAGAGTQTQIAHRACHHLVHRLHDTSQIPAPSLESASTHQRSWEPSHERFFPDPAFECVSSSFSPPSSFTVFSSDRSFHKSTPSRFFSQRRPPPYPIALLRLAPKQSPPHASLTTQTATVHP